MLYNIIRYSSNSDVIVLWYNYVTKYYNNINECNNNIVHRDWLCNTQLHGTSKHNFRTKFNCVIKARIHFPFKENHQTSQEGRFWDRGAYFCTPGGSQQRPRWCLTAKWCDWLERAIEQRWHSGACRGDASWALISGMCSLLSLQNHKNITLSAVEVREDMHDITYMCHLKHNTNESNYKTETDEQTQRINSVSQSRRGGREVIN